MPDLKLIVKDNEILADSRDVAEMITKRHDHLLRDIKNYMSVIGKTNFGGAEFFIESYYNDSQGKPRLHYFLTKKGCDMVANKMTGEKGILFTATYVTKFEEMEKQLRQPYKLPGNYKEALLQLVEKEEQKERLATENKMLEQRVAEYEPKVTYLDKILQSTDTVTISQIAEDYGMSGQKMNKALHEAGIQYKLNKQWLLYSKHKGEGYTKSNTVPITHKDGTQSVEMHTKWTQKGRLFIYETLKKRDILPMMDIDLNRNLTLAKAK